MSEFNGFGTLAIHAGQKPDPITGAVVPNLSLSTTYAQESPGVHKGFEYSRTSNPTRVVLENNFAALEKAKHGLAFSSGSAATMTILHLLKAGDHVVSCDDVYGGTNRYFQKIAAKFGLEFTFVDLTDVDKVKAAIKENTKLVWVETPTNPMLKIVDIAAVSEAVHAANKDIVVVTDNTFASPYNQQPLTLGSDLVVHSVTKYLNGHGDVVMGVVATNSDELNTQLRFLQNGIGAIPSPFDCYQTVRGLKTLHLRMKQHAANAAAVADLLGKSDKVLDVIYPGLPSHPQHELAKKQMRTAGGMVSFHLKGGIKETRQFMENLKLFELAESLGSVESLANHPAIMTHAAVPEAQRAELGITDALVRLSVGVEEIEDILADLTQALDAITA